jgi:hypothetical protein
MGVWRPKKLNYEKNYYDYINYVKTLNRNKNDNKYYELHHILPKSIYPNLAKDKNNLVLLTAREHFLAHYLLMKIYEVKQDRINYEKMFYAFIRMCNCIDNDNRPKYVNSRLYEANRKMAIQGKREISEETREKMKIANSLKWQDENYRKQQTLSHLNKECKTKGKIAYTNGADLIYLSINDPIPEGYIKGGLKCRKNNKGHKIFYKEDGTRTSAEKQTNGLFTYAEAIEMGIIQKRIGNRGVPKKVAANN